MSVSTERAVNGIEVPPAGTYTFDPAHTTVEFIGTHMFTKTRGRFTEAEGTIVIGDDRYELVAGERRCVQPAQVLLHARITDRGIGEIGQTTHDVRRRFRRQEKREPGRELVTGQA